MSRIEEALEKAAQLRNGRPVKVPPLVTTPPPAHPDRTTDTSVGIKVTNPLLVAASDPLTPIAEEYRKLKSALVSLTKGESFRNMLMVTSAVSCEGKSITALNLALSLAQDYDHTVLLVDADLRKPSLHSYLGLEPRAGLSECLREGVPLEDLLCRTGIGKLSFLPAGKEMANPAELLSSQKARDLVLEVKRRYPDRYVIVDAPPVLPFADVRSLNAMKVMDGVVLVVKEGLASMQQIRETIDCLKGVEILGIVYNQATVTKEYDHYQYYRYYRRSYANAT